MHLDDRQLIILRNRMGEDLPVPPKRKPRDLNVQTESQAQQSIMKWWRWACITEKVPEHLLMAFPLQGHRTAQNGARMKAEGMRAGTPDMLLAVPRGKYHALFIELKTEAGKLSPLQKVMLSDLDKQGYVAFACYGAEQATKLIGDYLRGEEFF